MNIWIQVALLLLATLSGAFLGTLFAVMVISKLGRKTR